MIHEIASLSTIAVTFFIVTVSPGPATISNATIAMRFGRKTGLSYGAGLSCGLAFWGVIAASGTGAILQGSLYLLMLLKISGGLYLLWLAFLSAQAAWNSEDDSAATSSDRNWFLQGLLLNLSNPKAVLAWMAALSIGLNSSDGFYKVALATVVCIVVGFVVYAIYSFLFSVRSMMRAYHHCRRWVQAVMAGLFGLAGTGLIRSSFVQ